ncbi:hypothetical protein ES705_18372 [subsurface metagenome]
MSLELYVAVLEAKIGDPSLKSVLLGMANHAGPDGSHCYPGVWRLVIYTGLSESTVRRKLNVARKEKLIKVVKEAEAQRPTEYRMNLGLLERMIDPKIAELKARRSDPSHSDTPLTVTPHPSHSDTPPLSQCDPTPLTVTPEPSINHQEPLIEPSVKVTNRIRKFAEDVFKRETGDVLKPTGNKKEDGKRWWMPLRGICQLVADDDGVIEEKNVEALIMAAVRHMDEEELDYDSPASIEKVCRSIVSKARRGKYRPKKSLDEMAEAAKQRRMRRGNS